MADRPDEPLYDDGDFVELPGHRLPSPYPEQAYYQIRHKPSGNMFRVLAKDRSELAEKISVGDWESDPDNKPATDAEEDD